MAKKPVKVDGMMVDREAVDLELATQYIEKKDRRARKKAMRKARRRPIRGLLGLTGAALGGLYFYSRQQVKQLEEQHPPVGSFVEIDDETKMHYLSAGAGAPVVLIHGSDGILQDFSMSIFDKVAREFRVIAVDRPGHGYSGRPDGTPLTLGTNVSMIRTALQRVGVERPILVGHSFGAAVALRFALDHPSEISGLMLLSPKAYRESEDVPLMYSLPGIPVIGPLFANTLMTPLVRFISPGMNARAFWPDPLPTNFETVMEAYTARPNQFLAWAEENRLLGEALAAMSPRYAEITMPVTIITGEEDQQTRAERQAEPLHNAIPSSRLVKLAHTGHEVHHKYPDLIADEIRALSQMAGERRAAVG